MFSIRQAVSLFWIKGRAIPFWFLFLSNFFFIPLERPNVVPFEESLVLKFFALAVKMARWFQCVCNALQILIARYFFDLGYQQFHWSVSRVDFILIILLGMYCASCICGFMYFINSGKFSASLKILPLLHFLTTLLSYNSHTIFKKTD